MLKWLRILINTLRSALSGKRGVPQGGVLSPLLSNLYLNEVDEMLERAKTVTRHCGFSVLEYARFADDLVVLVSAHPKQRWLRGAVEKRLREEFAKLEVEVNEEKSRRVDLTRGESAIVSAPDEEAYGTVASAQGRGPESSFPTGRSGDRVDQSDFARLGELLCDRSLESVLFVHPPGNGATAVPT